MLLARIAMFTAKFDPTLKNPWLTDELCETLDDEGHSVDVFFLDWYRQFNSGVFDIYRNSRLHIINPVGSKSTLILKIIHWSLSSFNLYRYYKANFKTGDHDLLISFSPSVMFGIVLLGLKSYFRKRVLIQWDFFPYHQEQIGLIPQPWIVSLGAAIETKLISTFTFIGCMSQRNIVYLREHYKLPPLVACEVLPLWAKIRPKPHVNRSKVRLRYGVPEDAFVAVFGGQLAEGRGIEDIVRLAKLAQNTSSLVRVVVIGAGPRLRLLLEESSKLDGYLIVLKAVARNDYLDLVASFDVGLVLTVPNVNIPSFPSKVLDYCCVGIPVAAAVENTTDFGEFIVAEGFGQFCEAGKYDELFEILDGLSKDQKLVIEMGENARRCYENYFNVRNVAATITRMVPNA